MLSKSGTLNNILATCRKELVAVFWFCFGINLLILAMPLYSLQLFDRVLSSRSIETLIMLTLIVVLCLIVHAALIHVRQSLLHRLGEKIELHLSEKVIVGTIRKVIISQGNRNSQDVRDVQYIANFFSGHEISIILDIPWSPLYLGVIFLFDSTLGWVASSGILVIVILGLLTEVIAGGQVKRSSLVLAKATYLIDMITRQAEAVFAMGMMRPMTRMWQQEQRAAQQTQSAATDRINMMANITRLARMLLQVAVMVTAVLQVLNATITPGAMIVANILMAKTLAPAEAAIATWKATAQLRAAVQRIDTTLRLWQDYSLNTRLPTPQGAVQFDRVTVTVGSAGRPVLRNVSFAFKAGEMIGLVGPSGAGKTTLGRALVNAAKIAAGTIRLDKADIVSWDPHRLGAHVGYLPQSVELFKGSIARNIARFTDAPSQAIIDAAKLAGVHDLIMSFRLGYDTEIGGDDGIELSGGQKQRIGLARAYFGLPKLIVLDEPNASLDGEGERALINALAAMKQLHATLVVIAHRPSILTHADRIILLRDGVIEAQGTLQEMAPKLGFTPPRPRIVASAAPADGSGAA